MRTEIWQIIGTNAHDRDQLLHSASTRSACWAWIKQHTGDPTVTYTEMGQGLTGPLYQFEAESPRDGMLYFTVGPKVDIEAFYGQIGAEIITPPDGITPERFAQVVAEAEAGYPDLVAAFNRISPAFQLAVPATNRERLVALGDPDVVQAYDDAVAEQEASNARKAQAVAKWEAAQPATPLDGSVCDLCGETADGEMGEYWDEAQDASVVAHVTCGTDAGLRLA